MRVQTQRAEVSSRFPMLEFLTHSIAARSPKRPPVRDMNVAGVSPLQAPLRHAVAATRATRCRNRAVVTVRAGWFDNFGASTDNKRDAEFRRQQARAQARHGAAVSVGADACFHIKVTSDRVSSRLVRRFCPPAGQARRTTRWRSGEPCVLRPALTATPTTAR